MGRNRDVDALADDLEHGAARRLVRGMDDALAAVDVGRRLAHRAGCSRSDKL